MNKVMTGAMQEFFGVGLHDWQSFGNRMAEICARTLGSNPHARSVEVEKLLAAELERFRARHPNVPQGKPVLLIPQHGGSLNFIVWSVPATCCEMPGFAEHSKLPADAKYFGMFPSNPETVDIYASQETGEVFAFWTEGQAARAQTKDILHNISRMTAAEILDSLPIQLVAGAVLATREFAN